MRCDQALEHLFKDRVDILRTDASEVNSGSLLSIRSERYVRACSMRQTAKLSLIDCSFLLIVFVI